LNNQRGIDRGFSVSFSGVSRLRDVNPSFCEIVIAAGQLTETRGVPMSKLVAGLLVETLLVAGGQPSYCIVSDTLNRIAAGESEESIQAWLASRFEQPKAISTMDLVDRR
jgi:hypothetical protein